jgi:O-antigen ligase
MPEKYSFNAGTFLLIACIGVLPIIYFRNAVDPVLIPRMLFLSILLTVFISWLLFFKKRVYLQSILYKKIFTIIYFAYVLFCGISLIVTVNPGDGIMIFLQTATLLVLFVVASALFQHVDSIHVVIPRIVLLYASVILSAGIYDMITLLLNHELSHQASYMVTSLFAHRNMFAEMLLHCFPFLLMGIFFHKKVWRIFFVAITMIALIMIALLLVRAVWLALITAFAVSLLANLIFRKTALQNLLSMRNMIVIITSFTIVVIASSTIYKRYGNIETLTKQTYVLGIHKYGSALERLNLWEKTFDMYKNKPLTGVGAGSWKVLLPKYGTENMRSAEGNIIFQRPHNDFLWVLVENGILAFIFYLALFLLAFFYLGKLIHISSSKEDTYLSFALLFFLISYMIIALLSFPKERPDQSIFVNIVLAVVVAKYYSLQPPEKCSVLSGILVCSIALLVLVPSIYASVIRLRSEIHFNKAFDYHANNRWNLLISEIDKAETYFTRMDQTATPLRWYSGLAWFRLGDFDKALSEFKIAYHCNPYHLHVLNSMATCYILQDNYHAAIEKYNEALKISPTFVPSGINLSVAYFLVNKPELSYQALISTRIKTRDVVNHPHFRNLSQSLTAVKIDEISETIEDPDILTTLIRIKSSDEWMTELFGRALNDSIALEDRLIFEVIYTLEVLEQSIDSNRASLLRTKYLHQ